MFDFQFNGDNSIVLIDRPPIVSRSIKPVWADELNILGIDRWFDYPKNSTAPLLWSCTNKYYYCGVLVFETRLNDSNCLDIIVHNSLFQKFEPINILALLEKNAELLQKVVQKTKAELQSFFEKNKKNYDSFMVGFSGGKDSAVLLDLVLDTLPEEKIIINYSNTGMEFSNNEAYVERQFNKYKQKALNSVFWISKNPIPPEETWEKIGFPTRYQRWCCKVHKSGPACAYLISKGFKKTLMILGQRADESPARSKYEKFAKGEMNQDSFLPLLDWGPFEIWAYLFSKEIEINELYKSGVRRVGCICCPMTGGTVSCVIERNFDQKRREKFFDIVKKNFPRKAYNFDVSWRQQMTGRCLKSDYLAFIFPKKIHLLKPIKRSSEFWLRIGGLENKMTYDFSGMNKKEAKLKRGFLIKAIYCVGCGACAGFCSNGALKFFEDEKGRPFFGVDENKCKKCGRCVFCDTLGDYCFAHRRQKLTKKETKERLKNEGRTDLLSLFEEAEL